MMVAGDPQVEKLQQELAEVARKIARLLIAPSHDAAELAGLEAQAKQLRARIRQSQQREEEEVELVLRVAGNGRLMN